MKKIANGGFVLIETLLVTIFVAGVLVFLFIQFSNLSQQYEKSYKYNTVDSLYALDDIRNYILSDTEIMNYIENNIDSTDYIDLSKCYYFENRDYCLNLFEFENIETVIVLKNKSSYDKSIDIKEEMADFISQISNIGYEKYRLVALFKNSTLATLRFGDNYE